MASPSELSLSLGWSTDQVTASSHLSGLLHLFYHRNKNQHRHSIWFRHFGTFRQHLASLVRDVVAVHTTPPSHAARAKKKSRHPILISRIRARLQLWRDFLVPKWLHSFSQVIADRRFSVLGLFLRGVLAEVCQMVGITAELEEMGEEEAREARGRAEAELNLAERNYHHGVGEDAGELIARGFEAESVLEQTGDSPSVANAVDGASKGRKRPSSTALDERKTKPKKRKKAGSRDAIDEIFG